MVFLHPNHLSVSAHHAGLCLLFCLIAPSLCLCQSFDINAKKFSQFGVVSADDEEAYLDLFAEELQKESKLAEIVLAYRNDSTLPGTHLSMISLDHLDRSIDLTNSSSTQIQRKEVAIDASD